jgi:hypothetical protein
MVPLCLTSLFILIHVIFAVSLCILVVLWFYGIEPESSACYAIAIPHFLSPTLVFILYLWKFYSTFSCAKLEPVTLLCFPLDHLCLHADTTTHSTCVILILKILFIHLFVVQVIKSMYLSWLSLFRLNYASILYVFF